MIRAILYDLQGKFAGELQYGDGILRSKGGPKKTIKSGDRVFELDREWLANGALIYRERQKADVNADLPIPESGITLHIETASHPSERKPVTLTLERLDGSTEPFVFYVDESGNLPLRVERMELKNGFAGWALQYAARSPRAACVKRVYWPAGKTLVYKEG